jgi:hypothetical protein
VRDEIRVGLTELFYPKNEPRVDLHKKRMRITLCTRLLSAIRGTDELSPVACSTSVSRIAEWIFMEFDTGIEFTQIRVYTPILAKI